MTTPIICAVEYSGKEINLSLEIYFITKSSLSIVNSETNINGTDKYGMPTTIKSIGAKYIRTVKIGTNTKFEIGLSNEVEPKFISTTIIVKPITISEVIMV